MQVIIFDLFKLKTLMSFLLFLTCMNSVSAEFTIENTKLKAAMTNYGHLPPDPDLPNRFSVHTWNIRTRS